jgi:hypothetical protein
MYRSAYTMQANNLRPAYGGYTLLVPPGSDASRDFPGESNKPAQARP